MKTTLEFKEDEQRLAQWYMQAIDMWSEVDDLCNDYRRKADVSKPMTAEELYIELNRIRTEYWLP